jgi:hypothetical protein
MADELDAHLRLSEFFRRTGQRGAKVDANSRMRDPFFSSFVRKSDFQVGMTTELSVLNYNITARMMHWLFLFITVELGLPEATLFFLIPLVLPIRSDRAYKLREYCRFLTNEDYTVMRYRAAGYFYADRVETFLENSGHPLYMDFVAGNKPRRNRHFAILLMTIADTLFFASPVMFQRTMEVIWRKLSPDHRLRLKEVLPGKKNRTEQLKDHGSQKWWLFMKAKDKMSRTLYWAIQCAANARLQFGTSIGIQVRDVREWGTFDRFHIKAGWPFMDASVGTFHKDVLNCPLTDKEFEPHPQEAYHEYKFECPDDIVTSRPFDRNHNMTAVRIPPRPVSLGSISDFFPLSRSADFRARSAHLRKTLDRTDWDQSRFLGGDRWTLMQLSLEKSWVNDQLDRYNRGYVADSEDGNALSSSVSLSSTGLPSPASSSSSSSSYTTTTTTTTTSSFSSASSSSSSLSSSSALSSSSLPPPPEIVWDGTIDPTLKPKKYVNDELLPVYRWRRKQLLVKTYKSREIMRTRRLPDADTPRRDAMLAWSSPLIPEHHQHTLSLVPQRNIPLDRFARQENIYCNAPSYDNRRSWGDFVKYGCHPERNHVEDDEMVFEQSSESEPELSPRYEEPSSDDQCPDNLLDDCGLVPDSDEEVWDYDNF